MTEQEEQEQARESLIKGIERRHHQEMTLELWIFDNRKAIGFSVFESCGSVNINVKNKGEVDQARANLRTITGEWSDRVDNVHMNGDFVIVQYTGHIHGITTCIRLTCAEKDIPKGVLKPSCKIVDKIVKTIVCEV